MRSPQLWGQGFLANSLVQANARRSRFIPRLKSLSSWVSLHLFIRQCYQKAAPLLSLIRICFSRSTQPTCCQMSTEPRQLRLFKRFRRGHPDCIETKLCLCVNIRCQWPPFSGSDVFKQMVNTSRSHNSSMNMRMAKGKA